MHCVYNNDVHKSFRSKVIYFLRPWLLEAIKETTNSLSSFTNQLSALRIVTFFRSWCVTSKTLTLVAALVSILHMIEVYP